MPKAKKIKKRFGLEDLALMVAKGFEENASKMASKRDLDALASKRDLDALASDLDAVRQELKTEIADVKREMVTKSYLDDKLADLEGSVIVRQRKEDQKVNLLIDLLKRKKILGKVEIKMLHEIQVFPSSRKI